MLSLAECNKPEIARMPTIMVLLPAKNWSMDHGKKNQISVSPGMSILLFQTGFKCSLQYRPPVVWEAWIAEKQNDGISGSKG